MLGFIGKISENVYGHLADLQVNKINYCLPQQSDNKNFIKSNNYASYYKTYC